MKNILIAYRGWRYYNTSLLLFSFYILYLVGDSAAVHHFIAYIGTFGYLGAFIAGIFFVSTFTVLPSGVLLYHLAQDLNPFIVAVAAGGGAVIGDYLIFRFLRDNVFEELKPIFSRLGGNYVTRVLSTPYFTWLAPVIGAIIIASPFPDELGISLMGISQMKNWQFLVVTYILNTLGIFVIVTLARSF